MARKVGAFTYQLSPEAYMEYNVGAERIHSETQAAIVKIEEKISRLEARRAKLWDEEGEAFGKLRESVGVPSHGRVVGPDATTAWEGQDRVTFGAWGEDGAAKTSTCGTCGGDLDPPVNGFFYCPDCKGHRKPAEGVE